MWQGNDLLQLKVYTDTHVLYSQNYVAKHNNTLCRLDRPRDISNRKTVWQANDKPRSVITSIILQLRLYVYICVAMNIYKYMPYSKSACIHWHVPKNPTSTSPFLRPQTNRQGYRSNMNKLFSDMFYPSLTCNFLHSETFPNICHPDPSEFSITQPIFLLQRSKNRQIDPNISSEIDKPLHLRNVPSPHLPMHDQGTTLFCCRGYSIP